MTHSETLLEQILKSDLQLHELLLKFCYVQLSSGELWSLECFRRLLNLCQMIHWALGYIILSLTDVILGVTLFHNILVLKDWSTGATLVLMV